MKPFLTAIVLVLLLGGDAVADGYQDFNFGVASISRKDWDGAVKSLSLALSEPDLPQHLRAVAHFDLGSSHMQKKQFDLAIADYTAAIQLKPDYIEAYNGRGAAYDAAKQFAKAVDDVTRAIALRPVYWGSYIQRIDIYVEMKNWDAAIADYGTLIAMDPNNAWFYAYRGKAYRMTGNYDLALADESHALDVDDKLPMAYAERGFDYAQKGKFDDAADDFRSDVHNDPNGDLAYLRRGQAQWDLGRFDDAADSFEDVLKHKPLQEYGFLWLSITLSRKPVAVPADIVSRFSAADLSKWPGPLVSLYLGKATPDDVAQAVKKADVDDQHEEVCSAHFFLGEWLRMHQDAAAGNIELQRAAQDCADDPIVRPAATADFNRPATP
jgi:tetratricopeptide (TPR) repeat protein